MNVSLGSGVQPQEPPDPSADNTPDDNVAGGGEDLSVLESVKKEITHLVARQDRHETAALLLIPSGENHQA